MKHLCFKNYSETVLQCYFYYDIQALPMQRTDIPLDRYRFMYRKPLIRTTALQVHRGRAFWLNLR